MRIFLLSLFFSFSIYCFDIKPIALSDEDFLIVLIDESGCLNILSEIFEFKDCDFEVFCKYKECYKKICKIPVNVKDKFKQVALGKNTLFVLSEGNDLYCAPSDYRSLLNSLVDRELKLRREPFFAKEKVTLVAANSELSLILCDTNTLFLKGRINFTDNKNRDYVNWEILKHKSKSKIICIVVGYDAVFIINDNGHVLSMGSNRNNLIGQNGKLFKKKYCENLTLISFFSDKEIRSISTNGQFSAAVDGDNNIWLFGNYICLFGTYNDAIKNRAGKMPKKFSNGKAESVSSDHGTLKFIDETHKQFFVYEFDYGFKKLVSSSETPLKEMIANFLYSLVVDSAGSVFKVGSEMDNYEMEKLPDFRVLTTSKWSFEKHRFFNAEFKNKILIVLLSLKRIKIRCPKPVLCMIFALSV